MSRGFIIFSHHRQPRKDPRTAVCHPVGGPFLLKRFTSGNRLRHQFHSGRFARIFILIMCTPWCVKRIARTQDPRGSKGERKDLQPLAPKFVSSSPSTVFGFSRPPYLTTTRHNHTVARMLNSRTKESQSPSPGPNFSLATHPTLHDE